MQDKLEMMLGQKMRKYREYPGPNPPCVLIRARSPSGQQPERLILENRKKREELNQMCRDALNQKRLDLRNEWEKYADRNALVKDIRKEIDRRLQTHDFSLEERRDRLREKLREEEQTFIAAMEAAEETTLERQARMRAQTKSLRERKEKERLQFVQEKYDQQFREQCDELRSTLSRREQDLVHIERMLQLKDKEEEARQRKSQDAMFAQLWEKDRQEKMAREEREALEAQDKKREALNSLEKQLAAHEAQRAEAKRQKEDEKQLLKEQDALQKKEDAMAEEEKRRQQHETRDMLELNMRIKNKKKVREEQEQLAFDLKMLEKHLEETQNEAREQLQRKVELREEDKRYREHLAQQREEEKQKEHELEEMMKQQIDADWEKRDDSWRTERRMRLMLLEDTIAGRNRQIQERLAQKAQRQAEKEIESGEICDAIEELRQYDAQMAAKRRANNVSYQNDLQGQISYNNQMRDEEHHKREYENLMCLQAELEYREKLKQTLENPVYEKLHPIRRAMHNQEKIV